jgi:hypothetical protein
MKNLREKTKLILISAVSICVGVIIGQVEIDKEALAQNIAWIGPTQAPPQGNVGAPINIGTDGQSKAGSLVVGSGNSAAGPAAGLINTKFVATDSQWFAYEKIVDVGMNSPVGLLGFVEGSSSTANDGIGILGASWYDYGVMGRSLMKTGVYAQGGIYGVESKINLFNGSIYARLATNDGIKPASILEGRHSAGGFYYDASLGTTSALVKAATDNPATEGLNITTLGRAGTITARAGGLKIDTPNGNGMELSGTGGSALYVLNTNLDGDRARNFSAEFDGSVKIGGSRYYKAINLAGDKPGNLIMEDGDIVIEKGNLKVEKNIWDSQVGGVALGGGSPGFKCDHGKYVISISLDATGKVNGVTCAGL